MVVLHDPGEDYQEPNTFRSESSQVVKGVIEMSQVQIPNSDELGLIIFVSQGLTLSTASLVNETRVGEA